MAPADPVPDRLMTWHAVGRDGWTATCRAQNLCISVAAAPARGLAASLVLAGLLLLMPPSCWAYRPFIATDAAVADPQEVEIELGYFTLEQAKGETAFTIPRVVLNYGFLKNWEAVGEFAVLRSPGGELDLIDPALSVKGILREGVLQEKSGVSI